jgi:hypothetical protein
VKKRRRHPRERQLVFHWERTAPAFAWISRRRAGAFGLFAACFLVAWTIWSVDDRRRRTNATRAAIRSVMLAADAFRADHGRCPTSIDELVTPPEVAGVTSRYLSSVRLDGWDRPLRMTCPGGKHPGSVDVVSGGPTGTFLDLEQIE